MREKLLTPEQVAAWLQVRVELLYKWRYSRCGPPSLKIGRYVRYREVDVVSWIEGALPRAFGMTATAMASSASLRRSSASG